MTKQQKIDATLTKLYKLVWQYNLSDELKEEANKIAMLYSYGRLNEIQACYRLCLILNGLAHQMYTEKQNHIVLDILQ